MIKDKLKNEFKEQYTLKECFTIPMIIFVTVIFLGIPSLINAKEVVLAHYDNFYSPYNLSFYTISDSVIFLITLLTLFYSITILPIRTFNKTKEENNKVESKGACFWCKLLVNFTKSSIYILTIGLALLMLNIYIQVNDISGFIDNLAPNNQLPIYYTEFGYELVEFLLIFTAFYIVSFIVSIFSALFTNDGAIAIFIKTCFMFIAMVSVLFINEFLEHASLKAGIVFLMFLPVLLIVFLIIILHLSHKKFVNE